jgi:hypothetical protein
VSIPLALLLTVWLAPAVALAVFWIAAEIDFYRQRKGTK